MMVETYGPAMNGENKLLRGALGGFGPTRVEKAEWGVHCERRVVPILGVKEKENATGQNSKGKA